MPNRKSEHHDWWRRSIHFVKIRLSLFVISIEAVFVMLITGVMYLSSEEAGLKLIGMLMDSEMDVITLTIRKNLAKVQSTVENVTWVVADDLRSPDLLFRDASQMVEHNPDIYGTGIMFIPDYYPEWGRWFEPYAVRKDDGTVESKQLGGANHDYLVEEFFTEPIAANGGYWCEPYLDKDGAKAIVSTYSAPVHDDTGRIVAVIGADISLSWLEDIINENKMLETTQRFLVTADYTMLAGENIAIVERIIDKVKNGKEESKGYFKLSDHQKNLKHVYFNPVGGKTGWTVFCVVDDNAVFGPLRRVQYLLLLMVLASVLVLGFIIWRTSRNQRRLLKVKAEKDRYSSELHVAHDIQQSLLPQNYLKQDHVEIFGSVTPAREVGGDLFDYFFRDNKLYFCVGDVSGKGTPAAMLMSSTRSLFRAFSTRSGHLADYMGCINKALSEGNDSCMFVTFFMGVLDLATGRLQYCNGGHDAPVILAGGSWTMLQTESNIPLGLSDEEKFELQETVLQPDSTIFLYTDGLTEATSSQHELFGMQRVQQALQYCVDAHPRQILATVTEEMKRFVGDAEQSDDLTMLAIRYTPTDSPLSSLHAQPAQPACH